MEKSIELEGIYPFSTDWFFVIFKFEVCGTESSIWLVFDEFALQAKITKQNKNIKENFIRRMLYKLYLKNNMEFNLVF